MENQITGTNESQDNLDEIKDWASAFAALEPKSDEAVEGDTGGTEVPDTGAAAAGQTDANASETADATQDADTVGGLDPAAADVAEQSGGSSGSLFDEDINEESIAQYEKSLKDEVRDRSIREVAQEFIKRGVRHSKDGALGATLDDSDIMKRDEDGIPHFYNPETGNEFTGDNPRKQAQEWVDYYNKELARVFNSTCEKYEAKLLEDSAPRLAVMKFVPKYNKLDDIRRGMLDNVIQDYEITDNGKVVGYTCDLDKALAMVERQIAMIQEYAKSNTAKKVEPSGPALDMKTSSGAIPSGEQKAPESLAEAMEQLQDRQLANLKRN